MDIRAGWWFYRADESVPLEPLYEYHVSFLETPGKGRFTSWNSESAVKLTKYRARILFDAEDRLGGDSSFGPSIHMYPYLSLCPYAPQTANSSLRDHDRSLLSNYPPATDCTSTTAVQKRKDPSHETIITHNYPECIYRIYQIDQIYLPFATFSYKKIVQLRHVHIRCWKSYVWYT